MSYAEETLVEFDQEMASTRKVLERIPDDKLEWRCHPKSNTLGWNANHLAENPGWVPGILLQPHLDCAPVGGEPYKSPDLKSMKEILAMFDKGVADARKAIEQVKDKDMDANWSLLQAGTPIITMSRRATMRNFVLNHVVHHRAIVCVYLRLNNIPVPGMYGPSGDET
jgi:uncharacterized damage-inducible protein DinB